MLCHTREVLNLRTCSFKYLILKFCQKSEELCNGQVVLGHTGRVCSDSSAGREGHQRAHAVSTVPLSISVQLSSIDFA